MAIDNRRQALEMQIRADEVNPATAAIVRGLKVLAGRVPVFGVLIEFVLAVLDRNASDARVASLLTWMDEDVQHFGKRLDELTDRLGRDDFIETLVLASERTQRTVEMKKVQRFAAVLGCELVSEQPDWEEAQAFIRDISELGEEDIKALRRLHDAERRYQEQPIANRNLRHLHDEDYYTQNALINNDEFYSRCGRLYGFGLGLLNHETTRATPQHRLFRISPRGARLVDIIVDPRRG